MNQLLFRNRVIAASIALSSAVTICVGKLAAAQDTFVGTTQLYVGSQSPAGFFDQSTPITAGQEALAVSFNGQSASVGGSVGDDTVSASAMASNGGVAIIDQTFYDTISATNLALTGTTVDLDAYITVGSPTTYVSGNGSYFINETLSVTNSSILFGPSEFLTYAQSYGSLYGLSISSNTSGSIPIIIGDKYTITLDLNIRASTNEAGETASVSDDPGFYFSDIPDDLTITSSSGASYAAPATAPEDSTWAIMAILMLLGGVATFCNIRRTQPVSADQNPYDS
jgi:hypothetical protein